MPTDNENSDELEQLLVRVRAGEEPALVELLHRYEPRLRTAARVLLGPLLRPHLDSLDLVQSVHRTLLPGLQEGKYELSDGRQLVALALTVIRRKVADNWRRVQKEQEAAANFQAGTEDDPAALVQASDSADRILAILEGPDRELVELRLQGLSTPDIAAKLGLDAHALRARLSRIRQRLREVGHDEWI